MIHTITPIVNITNIKPIQTSTEITVTNLLPFDLLSCGCCTRELFSGLGSKLLVTNGIFVVLVVVADADICDKFAGSKTMRQQA